MMKSAEQLSTDLYRRLEKLIARGSRQESGLKASTHWAKVTTWVLVGAAGFGIAWLTLGKTEEIVVVAGKLEPKGQVRAIQVPGGGVVAEVLVKDGQSVGKGALLMRIDSEAAVSRQASLEAALRSKQRQLDLKLEELDRYLALNAINQSVVDRNLLLTRQIEQAYKRLAAEGASPELQYLEQKNKVQELEGQQVQTRVDKERVTAQLQQAVSGLRSEIEDIRSRIAENAVTLRYQEIRSPVAGVVFDVKPAGRGYVSQNSEPLLKIVPKEQLVARVQVPSSQIGFVHTGQQADVSIDSFPATDFGVILATVKSIGSDALEPEQGDPNARKQLTYPAELSLQSQSLKLKNGTSLTLLPGMSLTANIKLRSVSYLQLLMGGLNDSSDALRQRGVGPAGQ